jgi:hypothetical protein
MSATLELPPAASAPPGLRCPACRGGEFESGLDDGGRARLTCAACGIFIRLLQRWGDPAPEAAPPVEGESEYSQDDPLPGSWWLGLVASRAGTWRAVALGESQAAVWEALLTCPLAGTYMTMPCDPPKRAPGPADLPLDQPAAWVGWHRPDRRSAWRPLVEGATEAEATAAALDQRLGGDWLFRPRGDNPNAGRGRTGGKGRR